MDLLPPWNIILLRALLVVFVICTAVVTGLQGERESVCVTYLEGFCDNYIVP